VVGWLIAESESAVLAEKLLADTIAKHDIDRDQLTMEITALPNQREQ
jgi:putative transposase